MQESTDTVISSNKPKVRLLIKISLVLSVILFLLMVAEAVTFYIYLESGGLNQIWGDISTTLFPSCYLIPFIGLIAIIGIISTLKKPKDANFTIAVASLVIILIAVLIHGHISQKEPLRYWAHNRIDFLTLNFIRKTLPEYAKNHEGKLPLADNWYKDLLDYSETSTDPNINSSPRTTKERQRRFAFNLAVGGMPLSEIDPNTVLIFEMKYNLDLNFGKELIGEADSITATHHYGKGSVVLFADMHIEFVRAEDFKDLRWEP